ncbi:ferrous iron transport protein B [Chitinophaga pinensis]|uniref:Ferrous iron transport protein B n=1 Tax=Chitinophaga pinensis (strain ATCC 43595 / DSM 2588 / LMG 13176 / NBRC 15968 / NCIMB 11800 / UQM 2034) TaxID=485918 RepID=A0A979GME1_CHIPD|nr:ferrous iron transport protein B [Chitinophaga pinensis]ACU58282.1 ferrous iron transport protein B [Chitinophaga pinensis DSM 2588]
MQATKKATINIALVGNPNSGKSSLFNALTGLNQKVSNFPGVTVDKKTGAATISSSLQANIIDLPGTYSLYPKSADEFVTYDVLVHPAADEQPDMILIIADASNLKRNLLFCSQIMDLKIPVIIGLTMMDIARKKGVEIDEAGLERELGVPIVSINPRKNKGVTELKKMIDLVAKEKQSVAPRDFIDSQALAPEVIQEIRKYVQVKSDYAAMHIAVNHHELAFLNGGQKLAITNILQTHQFNKTKVQAEEIMQRYARIKHIMKNTVVEADPLQKQLQTEKLDNILLHRFWGYMILLGIMFFMFQSIFWLASFPMDWIEAGFGWLSGWLTGALPANQLTDILVNGVIAGLGGIAVFVPQIMILFAFITVLEDTGYMARISFLTDRLMRQVGLNGKSVMPLISGVACAVPAIMATRNIENRKERLITILITPLMSCSARLPIYTVMIALVVPDRPVFGFLSLQGLVMMGLYLLGFVMALFIAAILKLFIKIKEKSYFIMELPVYRAPRWANVGTTMVQKAKIFITDAGKVIMVISIVLWFLASFGPKDRMEKVTAHYEQLKTAHPEQSEALDMEMQSEKLGNSYAGVLGHAIEPVIRPLGYDWKIGIALITSFAAREVFVGTMATLYSVGESPEDNDATLREKMTNATWKDGRPVYTLASGISLMLFYAFAMQCMSTLAIVKRETKSWKMPAIQFVYMTALAYISALIAFQLLN